MLSTLGEALEALQTLTFMTGLAIISYAEIWAVALVVVGVGLTGFGLAAERRTAPAPARRRLGFLVDAGTAAALADELDHAASTTPVVRPVVVPGSGRVPVQGRRILTSAR